MKIDFRIRSGQSKRCGGTTLSEAAVPADRPTRVAGLLALAHRYEKLLQTGVVKDYAELAWLGHISRARITQIMNLLDLAPAIQECVLGVQPTGWPKPVTERQLRRIVREVRWDRQVGLFEAEISQGSS